MRVISLVRQGLKTEWLFPQLRDTSNMKSGVTKAGYPLRLAVFPPHFPAQEKLLNLPGGLRRERMI